MKTKPSFLRSLGSLALVGVVAVVAVAPGCAAEEAEEGAEVAVASEEGNELIQGGLVFSAAGVGKATAALGTALVCNAVCVTVAVVAVVGTVATVAYLNAQDQSKVPVSTVKQYRFNLDWVYAGNYCPAVSQAGYEMLSGRYSRCLAGKGGVNACQGRTFDEAKKVASCEAAKGGAACVKESYVASSSASGSSSQECKVGNERFCKNLNWRYKEECGKDQFSALSCKSLKTCEDLWEMAERAARCERGRELMRTKCIDKKWHDSGHQKAIDHAGDVWNDCLDLYEVAWRGCGKAPDDFFEKATKDFVKNVYTCQ